MVLSRRGALAGIGSVAASSAFASTGKLDLQTVIRRHTAARGGAGAMDRVKSAAIDLVITEKGPPIAAHYLASVERLVRIDIIIDGKRVYSEGVDTKGVWLWPGGEPAARDSTATGSANALLHGVESNLIGLHRFPERGHRLRLLDPEAVDGVHYQVVEATYSSGHVTNFYIDPSDWMIHRKRDDRAYHPDMDASKTWVESRYLDFRPTDGVIYSNRDEDYDLRKNALLSVAEVKGRRINPPIPAGAFERTFDPTGLA